MRRRAQPVDTTGMNNTDWEQLRENESWRNVLAAYLAEHSVQKTINPEHDGWLSRLREIEGVDGSELPRIHGKLIAYGFLKFQLAGRTEGVQYQVSSFGRESLQACREETVPANDDEDYSSEAA